MEHLKLITKKRPFSMEIIKKKINKKRRKTFSIHQLKTIEFLEKKKLKCIFGYKNKIKSKNER